MVRIRLRRTGKKKQPSYRVVVADSRSPRDGKFIEIIGHYHPVLQPKELVIKNERARYWLSVGAQPSDTVVKLLKRVNVLDTDGNVTAEDAVSEEVAPVAETPAPKKAKAAPKTTKAAAEPVVAEAVAVETEPVTAVAESVAEPVAAAPEAEPVAAAPEAEPDKPVASE